MGAVREEVRENLVQAPIRALEPALVLLEAYQTSRPETAGCVPGDAAFLGRAFQSKRRNGWMALLGRTACQLCSTVTSVHRA